MRVLVGVVAGLCVLGLAHGTALPRADANGIAYRRENLPVILVGNDVAKGCNDPQTEPALVRCFGLHAHAGVRAEDDEPSKPDIAGTPHQPSHIKGVQYSFRFPSGSAELSTDSIASLRVLGGLMAKPVAAGVRFRIEGHTDTVGPDDLNLTLSQARAEAVVTYLRTEFQIDPSRLEAVGMGKKNLVVDTPDQTPEARNRVVRIVKLPS